MNMIDAARLLVLATTTAETLDLMVTVIEAQGESTTMIGRATALLLEALPPWKITRLPVAATRTHTAETMLLHPPTHMPTVANMTVPQGTFLLESQRTHPETGTLANMTEVDATGKFHSLRVVASFAF